MHVRNIVSGQTYIEANPQYLLRRMATATNHSCFAPTQHGHGRSGHGTAGQRGQLARERIRHFRVGDELEAAAVTCNNL